ncbi:MAG TPA: glycoside hydrolase family 97 protein, partial [Planctomycetota bacterium]|nr:glycoside hydrolase family 97 protein [Planctomycetota bacterium]
IELTVPRGPGPRAPRFRVLFNQQVVLAPSRAGVELLGGRTLGLACATTSIRRQSRDGSYVQFPGKRSRVIDRYHECTVALEEEGPRRLRWEIVLRAYDDGVALRYVFPAQPGLDEVVIVRELTEFALPADAGAWALPLNGFTSSHEARYEARSIPEIPESWLLGLPFLCRDARGTWISLLEADLNEYAGLYLARAPSAAPGTLAARLSPLPGNPGVAVKARAPHRSPWRVLMVSDQLQQLVESDIVLNLNEPCAIPDTSWIHPGKTTFPWWNGFYEEKLTFPLGLDTATARYYIDFCAEAGIPYHSLDGIDNVAWYGGPIVPYEGAGITRGIEGLDLQEVIRYAREKKVGLRLWMHWEAARKHMDRAFPLYRAWGIEGVMIDFMDRDDQEMVRFCRELIRKAAENRLTVTLHGAAQPTGLERTYPNLLTTEGVLNLEYDKWDKLGCDLSHQVVVPFTRMLAGPLDFHQGSFRTVPAAEFQPRDRAPLVRGTPGRTLASYVVFQNHLPMAADYPSAYRGHPALPMLVQIPSTWDDTRLVAGEIGKLAVVARRHGRDWYVGAMAGEEAQKIAAPMGFLGPGTYRARVHSDDAAAPAGIAVRDVETSRDRTLELLLAPGGGCLVWLTPDGTEKQGAEPEKR